MVNFPTWISDCDFHNFGLLDLFFSILMLAIVLQWLSILVFGMVIVIFWEVFHRRMFWKLALLLNFVGRFSVSILDPTLFLIYINELPDDVICNIVIYAGDTNLYSRGMIRHHSISPPPFLQLLVPNFEKEGMEKNEWIFAWKN